MRESLLFLYDTHYPIAQQYQHPIKDDMFPRRDLLGRMLREGNPSLEIDLGVILSSPREPNVIPSTIFIAKNVEFDTKGDLKKGEFLPDRGIDEYPVVIDHAIAYFRYKGPDGNQPEQAIGVGIDENRSINPPPVQQYGNDKEATHRDILKPCGVALPSYNATTVDALIEEWGNNKIVIKHPSMSLSKGIQIVDSLADVPAEKMNRDNKYIFQPYLDLSRHIPGLVPATEAYAQQLEQVNPNDPREVNPRLKEVRMHFFATTQNEQINVDIYPTLSTSEPGAQFTTNRDWTPLDPEKFQEAYPHIHEKTKIVGRQLLKQAGVRNAYVAADWNVLEEVLFDFNCRGAYLVPDKLTGRDSVTPAQKGFVRMVHTMAETVFEARS